jgi:acyl-coenzyme A synthetase/AMP-(fatty) acid ligase
MARSMIYFYPTSDTPITADNVLRAVAACESDLEGMSGERLDRLQVTSFLSVPYILSTLAEDLTGPAMDMLSKLALVSTGGAPLDTATGDAMVAKGVKLVSRLGSSECGCKYYLLRD